MDLDKQTGQGGNVKEQALTFEFNVTQVCSSESPHVVWRQPTGEFPVRFSFQDKKQIVSNKLPAPEKVYQT